MSYTFWVSKIPVDQVNLQVIFVLFAKLPNPTKIKAENKFKYVFNFDIP